MSEQYYDNRELSWLKFNIRVLEEAENENVPLFERLGFVSIFSSNLDEFFSVRVGSLITKLSYGSDKPDDKTGLSIKSQLFEIAEQVSMLMARQDTAYWSIADRLSAYGVFHASTDRLSDSDLRTLKRKFIDSFLPCLTPVVAEKKGSIPFIPNKGKAVIARLHKNGEKLYGIIPVSDNIPKAVFLPYENGVRFVLAEDVIALFASLCFTGYELKHTGIIRITRSADIDTEKAFENENYRECMEDIITERSLLRPVRLEYSGMSRENIEKFMVFSGFGIGRQFVFKVKRPFDFKFTDIIKEKISDSSVFNKPLSPQLSAYVESGRRIIPQIYERDVLLMYPFESIDTYISLLNEAAENPDVVSIKITLYRVAKESKICEALIKAAKNGKNVLAVTELRARFDEENNIKWANRLETGGVRVICGLKGYKVHSKLTLITSVKDEKLSYISQIGTGNYNEKTSKQYTDISYITADDEIGRDAEAIFDSLSAGVLPDRCRVLLTAPNTLKISLLELIERETSLGKDGYIACKLNALTDKDLIDRFVRAGKMGVRVELMVRSACCLVGEIKGETDNIKVVSVVGRFLEHSRIYIFGKDEREQIYISSADLMTRNLDKRVEVAAPIRSESEKSRVRVYFSVMMSDNVKVRDQLPDGTYRLRRTEGEPLDGQIYFCNRAYSDIGKTAVKTGFLDKIKSFFTKGKNK